MTGSDTRSDTQGFRCPHCGIISHNPNDARERYCGNCHRFVDDALSDTRSDTRGDMTPDQAIAIKVRLDTARLALAAALEVVAACDRGENTIRVDLDLHQALRLASNSAGLCEAVMAGRATSSGSPYGYRSDTRVSPEKNDDQ